jgi:energy-coupling factor transporter transmembrane protein EcfT
MQRYFFHLLGAILIIYKVVEMIPARDFGFLFKFVPIVFIAALFYFVKENPFKINTELELEG